VLLRLETKLPSFVTLHMNYSMKLASTLSFVDVLAIIYITG